MARSVPITALPATYAPDLDEARSELARELARPEYADALPNPVLEFLEAAWTAFTDWLAGLESLSSGTGLVAVLLVIVGVAVAAVFVARPRLRRRAAARHPDVGLKTGMTSADYRGLAASAAAEQDWPTACLHRFRAMVRQAEERVILDPQPGRTAFEVAVRLESLFPGEADDLQWAATLFNAVRYGNHDAGISDWHRLDALESRLVAGTAGTAPGEPVLPMAAPR